MSDNDFDPTDRDTEPGTRPGTRKERLLKKVEQLKERMSGFRKSAGDATKTLLSGNAAESLKNLQGRLQDRLSNFDPSQTVDWINQKFQAGQKQSISFYGKLLTVILCTYFLADVLALVAGKFVPEPPAPRLSRHSEQTAKKPPLEEYTGAIVGRNLFSSQGLIPGDEGAPQIAQDTGGAPVRTNLPFNLVGTLILRDEMRSIATIEDKSASMVYPVRVQDEIPSKAKIIKIESERVIFLNISSGRNEYVELPELNANAPKITLGRPMKSGGIEQVSPTQFNINRAEVDAALGDLNNVLTQARAVPHFENGLPAGFKLFQIVPGSIYAKLGLQNNDIVTGMNGEPVDPGKAFSALNELKGGANHIEIQIKRDGRPMNMQFDVVR